MNKLNVVGVLAGAVLTVNLAAAQIITVRTEGIVDYVNFSGRFATDGSVGIGTLMTGTYVYDTETVPIASDTWYAEYVLLSASMSIGNYTFTAYPGTDAIFRVGTADPWHLMSAEQVGYEGVVYFNGAPTPRTQLPTVYDHLTFCDLLYATSTDPTFTKDLPTAFRDISDIHRSTFRALMSYDEGAYPNAIWSYFDIRGQVTSIDVVPEPATLLLLAAGSLAMLRKRKG